MMTETASGCVLVVPLRAKRALVQVLGLFALVYFVSLTFFNVHPLFSNYYLMSLVLGVVLPLLVAYGLYSDSRHAAAYLLCWTAFLLADLSVIVCLWGAWFVGWSLWMHLALVTLLFAILGPLRVVAALPRGWRSKAPFLLAFCLPLFVLGWRVAQIKSIGLLAPPILPIQADKVAKPGPRLPFRFGFAALSQFSVYSIDPEAGQLVLRKGKVIVMLDAENHLAKAFEDLIYSAKTLRGFMEERFGSIPQLFHLLGGGEERSTRFRLEGPGLLAYGSFDEPDKRGRVSFRVNLWDQEGRPLGSSHGWMPAEDGPPLRWLQLLFVPKEHGGTAAEYAELADAALERGQDDLQGLYLACAALTRPTDEKAVKRFSDYQVAHGRRPVGKMWSNPRPNRLN